LKEEISIEITKLKLFGAHGLFMEETLLENEFELNIILTYQPPEEITSIDQTLDYVKALEIVKAEFLQPSRLLETLALRIATKLKQSFPNIISQEINIIKLHPPIPSFRGEVGIRYKKEY
jgi:7,8-dihydroneopterin aldolase/epimerase/oxygenase